MIETKVEITELKPCPFCGGKAGIYSLAKYEKEVYCENCGTVSEIYETSQKAIEAWNRRAERTRHDDDERREVARRLREDPCDTLIPYKTGIHFGMGCHEAANRFWDMCERIKSAGDYDIAYSTRSVLADLIEPPTQCPYYHSDRHYCSAYDDVVDRGALLALADELEEDACWEVQSPGADNCAWRLKDVCDRIRKALGVES